MKCNECGLDILRPGNVNFSLEAYQCNYPDRYAGMMFDSIACATDWAEEHHVDDFSYISVPLDELRK